jgi:hypothetical protein
MKQPEDFTEKKQAWQSKTEDWLRADGFDGLWCPGRRCYCKIGDLGTCLTDKKHRKTKGIFYCHPGYLHVTKKRWKIVVDPFRSLKEERE